MQTTCTNQRNEEVLSGEAWVMPSKVPIVYEENRRAVASLALLTLQPWSWAAKAMSAWAAMVTSVTSAARR